MKENKKLVGKILKSVAKVSSESGLGQSDRQPHRRKIYPVLCRRVPFAFERKADKKELP